MQCHHNVSNLQDEKNILKKEDDLKIFFLAHLKVPSSNGVPAGPKMTADLTIGRMVKADKGVEDQ